MTDRSQTPSDERSPDGRGDGFRRREFVALGAGASAAMLAGCAGDSGTGQSDGSDGSDGSDDSDGTDGSDGSDDLASTTGSFRLLISDAPADIADFDRLDVTLDEARVFESGGDGEDDEGDETDDETGNETAEADATNETDSTNQTDDAAGDTEDDEEGEDDSDRGFTVVSLDGVTVDLTQVIEDDAIAVFDGEIPVGSYEKIELSVTTVEGIVDGESVAVKLPSEKLQITNGFEVTAEEPVSFVFDINVVKRGPKNGYILKPVISGSGVAGRDVEVNEVGDETGEEEDEEDEDEDGEDEDGDGTGDESTAGGNQTDTGSGGNETDGSTNETES
ncbi:DUF4382 domain-containing protein [Halorubrum sp. PV6]|uniref:DUF4382 domain-containing protein n=1 Tax=Halorubrum sp. PV6 TaxID=634157 RepID=UPI000F857230|nr:DUF4382 domain-containing protein [Halorubrum sp. PV6]AZQ15312.1 hypothetical protein DOS48_10980 [Halorubrum sp. PV6]